MHILKNWTKSSQIENKYKIRHWQSQVREWRWGHEEPECGDSSFEGFGIEQRHGGAWDECRPKKEILLGWENLVMSLRLRERWQEEGL